MRLDAWVIMRVTRMMFFILGCWWWVVEEVGGSEKRLCCLFQFATCCGHCGAFRIVVFHKEHVACFVRSSQAKHHDAEGCISVSVLDLLYCCLVVAGCDFVIHIGWLVAPAVIGGLCCDGTSLEYNRQLVIALFFFYLFGVRFITCIVCIVTEVGKQQ